MATDDDRFEDEEYDDRPRRRRERPDYEQEHRGGLILALGIIGLVMSCGPVGIAAWIMGNNDMKAMEAGQMDPEGKQLTQVGKILGMVSALLMIIGLCVGGGFIVIAALGAAAGG
ncbi:MAG TPA: DUF4190 domain-containing protein [Fimbriiglobus sp.]|nr:DUF4190 domain-containing protein [Fimbriiglobus sp.]